MSGIETVRAPSGMQNTVKRLDAILAACDILVTPCLCGSHPPASPPCSPHPAELLHARNNSLFPYTCINAAGRPAISLPVGRDSRGLPIAFSSSASADTRSDTAARG